MLASDEAPHPPRGARAHRGDVAEKETRSLWIPGADGAPAEGFAFVEMFCNEAGCDCRRVVLQVLAAEDPSLLLAQISYGWEPEGFYRKWASFPLSKEDLAELKGPDLMRLVAQSDRAEEMLSLSRTLLSDERYVARLVLHYHLFREVVEGRDRGAGAKPRGLISGWRSPSTKRRNKK